MLATSNLDAEFDCKTIKQSIHPRSEQDRTSWVAPTQTKPAEQVAQMNSARNRSTQTGLRSTEAQSDSTRQ